MVQHGLTIKNGGFKKSHPKMEKLQCQGKNMKKCQELPRLRGQARQGSQAQACIGCDESKRM